MVVCAAFGLTVSEAKPEIMCLRAKGMPESTAIFSVEAAGQVWLLLLFLAFSVLVVNPKTLLYTVANPARGLLNREKRKSRATHPFPPFHAARSEKNKIKITRHI